MAKIKKDGMEGSADAAGSPDGAPVAALPTAVEGGASASPDENANAEEKHRRLYTGASGQMAVMSEFLYRLINVAVPEVDVGDDVFVVREKDEAVTRVQVKQSKTESRQDGSYVAQFRLPWDQFDRDDTPALVYVLAVRHQNLWTDFVVIRRSVLQNLQAQNDVGTVAENETHEPTDLKLRLVFTKDGDVSAKRGFSLKKYPQRFRALAPAPLTPQFEPP